MVDLKKPYARPTLRNLGTREEAAIGNPPAGLRQAMDDMALEALDRASSRKRTLPSAD